MEFSETEAAEDNNQQPWVSSDDEEEHKITDELDDFIDNSCQPDEDVSFYRQLDPLNVNDYPKFLDQTRNPLDAIFEDDTSYYGNDNVQPELYAPKNRNFVIFDKFTGFEKSVEKLKKTLTNFGDSENQFFDAVIYGVMFHKSNGEIIDKNKMIQVLGEDSYNDFLEIKDEIKLDRTLSGYFKSCFVANQVLSKHNYFLKFFER